VNNVAPLLTLTNPRATVNLHISCSIYRVFMNIHIVYTHTRRLATVKRHYIHVFRARVACTKPPGPSATHATFPVSMAFSSGNSCNISHILKSYAIRVAFLPARSYCVDWQLMLHFFSLCPIYFASYLFWFHWWNKSWMHTLLCG
jgi:hypothetical protein